MRNIQCFLKLDPSLAGQTHVFAHDLSTAAIEIPAFSADRHEFDFLVGVLLKKSLRGFQQVGIKSSTQTFVGSYQDRQIAFVTARIEQWMVELFRSLRGQFAQDFAHLVGKRTRIDNAILRAFQFRRRDHLHRFGDLLSVLDRLNAPANV